MSSRRYVYGSRKKRTKTYDVIIIGGGIAGLYTAYKFKKMSPRTSIAILEKSDRLGGRICMKEFHGAIVPCGAGIIQKRDHSFIRLLNELHIPMTEFKTSTQYAFPHDREAVIHSMSTLKSHEPLHTENVEQFFIRILGEEKANNLIQMTGYEDYLNESAIDFMNDSSFLNDLILPWDAVSIDWVKFLKKLNFTNITHFNTDVISVDPIELGDDAKYIFIKATKTKGKRLQFFSCQKLICATAVDAVIKLFPDVSIYRQIQGQPFLRVFAKVQNDDEFRKLVPHLTVTSTQLKKIIPLTNNYGVHMISYSDNESARQLKLETNHLTKREKIMYYQKLLNESLNTRNIKLLDVNDSCYWPIGTHFFASSGSKEFLHRAQHPMENVFVVGEMVSLKHGWVEGALNSVDNILTEII